MKNSLSFFLVIALYLSSHAQTIDHKNNIAVGGGRESYNGDLGNAWFEFKEEWYGIFAMDYSRYLTPSLDIRASLTYGDYGHCRMGDDPVYWEDDGTERLNMLSRMTAVVIAIKYKFNNGYLLKEEARFAPYLSLGVGASNLANVWNRPRVETGNYSTLNIGGGIRYSINQKFNLTYHLGFGYFTEDRLDRRIEGDNDKYMQSSLSLGYSF